MLKQIAADLWTVEGPNITFAGAEMNTRMTVAKLSNGELWVHSPISYTADTAAALDAIGGSVCALVAPNKFHHLYIAQWLTKHPDARVFAERSLQAKVPSLGQADTLTNSTPELYAQEIDQVVFSGNRFFEEVVFFHKASRTLVFTDLMVNLRTDDMKLLPKLFLRLEGVVYPNGGVPNLFRWFTGEKYKAQAALAVIRRWAPQQIILCHGEMFTEPAETIIDQQFGWLDS